MASASFFDRDMDFGDDSAKAECFRFFDHGDKRFLSEEDFFNLTASLLKFDDSFVNEESVIDLFAVFDRNGDGKIDSSEFQVIWCDWIRPLVKPVTALLVVDVQNDFIDGSLALKNGPAHQDGSEVIPVINAILDQTKFDVVAYTMDHHPKDHISFFENVKFQKFSDDNEKHLIDLKPFDSVKFEGPPKMEQKLWPTHCVADTWGAKLHSDLKVADNPLVIYKGTNSKIDSYSAFWDNMKLSCTQLHDDLRQKNVTHVFVCGLAFDYCVSYTALDALELGYATTVIEDATRSIDNKVSEERRDKLEFNDCVITTSDQILDLVKGRRIRFEYAKVLANKLII